MAGRCVAGQHDRRAVDTGDQNAGAIVIGKAERAAHQRHATLAEPRSRRIEQALRHGILIQDLKEAKGADRLVRAAGRGAVGQGGDGAHDPPLPPGQKERHLGLAEQRVLGRGQVGHPLGDQGGHPVAVATVDLPGETDKGL